MSVKTELCGQSPSPAVAPKLSRGPEGRAGLASGPVLGPLALRAQPGQGARADPASVRCFQMNQAGGTPWLQRTFSKASRLFSVLPSARSGDIWDEAGESASRMGRWHLCGEGCGRRWHRDTDSLPRTSSYKMGITCQALWELPHQLPSMPDTGRKPGVIFLLHLSHERGVHV